MITQDYRQSHLHKGEDYDRDLLRRDFDRYMTTQEINILTTVVPRLFPGKIPRTLDFACGTGRITALLETLTEESYAVDISERMLLQARQKCTRTLFFHGDITQETLGIPPVNLVSAFRFFGNAQDELRLAALRALRRQLVKSGYLIFNNHRNPWSFHHLLLRCRGEPDVADLHYAKLRCLLNQAGFRLQNIYGIGVWVVRHKMAQPAVLSSRLARWLEPLSRLRCLGPFCPDAVIVAQAR